MRRWWIAVLALLVMLGGGAGALYLRQQEDLQATTATATPTPTPDPTRTPLLAPASASVPVPTASGLLRSLRPTLKDRALGSRVGLSVLDVATGRRLLEIGADRAVTPASTAKLVTALAALTVLPPEQRLTTRVVQGSRPGDVVLVGGGDPTLAGRFARPGYPQAPRLADLASQLAAVHVTRVVVDASLYAGPVLGPGWKPAYVSSGDVMPVVALSVDAGRTGKEGPRTSEPALQAGRELARLLHVTSVVTGRAAVGAVELAHVDSAPVPELVEAMLLRSDNDLAEALGRQVALALKRPATFAGETAAIRAAIAPLLVRAGVRPQAVALQDASGLSVRDQLQPAALTRLLALTASDDRYAALLSGLPVSGFDGTLAKRYRHGSTVTAAGVVRAKTGTLNGVSALAGLVRTSSGRLLAFDVTADGVPLTGTVAAQAALDRVAAALAACGCT